MKGIRYGIKSMLSPQMTFSSGLDIISIYFREMIKFMQNCWRSCNAWQQEYCFSIFWNFLKRVPAEKIFIEFKVYNKKWIPSISNASRTYLPAFLPNFPSKKILQPKKRLTSHLGHLLSVNRDNYLVSWLIDLFTGFEWKVFRGPVKMICNLSPSSR